MSRRSPRPLAIALGDLAAELAPASTLARIQRVWEQALGGSIAEAGRPTAEHDGVLTVTCSDSVWAQELDLMGPELVARLNLALGDGLVRSLRCRAG